MKRLTNPTLTFEVPQNIKKILELTEIESAAKLSIKQGNQIKFTFPNGKENSAPTYNVDEGKYTVTLTSDQTASLSPGIIKVELAIYVEFNDKVYNFISDTLTINVEDVLLTDWSWVPTSQSNKNSSQSEEDQGGSE